MKIKLLGLYKNSQVFKFALGVAIVLVCYVASVFYSQMQRLDSSLDLIAKSNQTQLELEKVLSVISMYETSLRSYIITKDETYLKNRFLDRAQVELNLEKIQKLSFNTVRSKDIDSLEKLIDYRFKLFRQTLTIAKDRKVNPVDLNAKLLESSNCTKAMRDFVYKSISKETNIVKLHNSSHQYELRHSMINVFLLVIISLLMVLLSYNKMNVDIDELKKTNDELKFLNHSFNNAEKIAGFGHWKFNLVTNTFKFSENFYRLMGVAPNSFEPKLENSNKYIHPDDFDRVMKVHKDSLKTRQPTNVTFRYLLDDGSIRHIMSVGSFTKNANGDDVKIGVNYDITEQYKRTLELEENNKQLEMINDELQAFNNIASHDLQEPLRKIQMFISRLEEKEIELLTPSGKDYFSKIKLASNRMQSLLIDLLNYSRAVKGDKVFVKTNLNDVMQQVLHDLATNIEDKKAEIEIGNLPKMKAIAFQMEQLFVNLISNSLKYSKDDVLPKIMIFAEPIESEVLHNGKPVTNEEYHKIVVIDNGIGFKQEYADKAFQLFKRLETNAKYTGTGLGLAICKRIIENHNGFITVDAKPNEGVKFSIFIPKAI
ncbi:ATP-binding protein [Flavobacterium sp.]|uniref:ATP-binding protein n=1 Tax=Flavobacterium sp. TaxID=239 RepID=UPI00286A5B10|nr:ATP-binding protein [Flavobacterium sp.]